MSLKSYQQKRKFTKTPEPKGQAVKNTGPLTFVIQKHQASQLHYDFRLELDGVLKSWAVPKGPSLNPEDKHLAVMVEDHPMEYANFEGIIPRGNYGAGTVMVWDYGVYSPLDTVERSEAEKILKEQLKKGHLTFVLLGKKLKGEFALVKSSRLEENAWLLIKKGDEYASPKPGFSGGKDILKKDRSALSNRTMSQIESPGSKKQEIWSGKLQKLELEDVPQEKMPHAVKPMLAKTIDKPFDNPGWIFEMKWDGYRALAEIESGKVRLYSRNNQPYNEKFAPIAKSLEKFPGNAVLDGEVVVVDSKGHPNFGWLQDYPKSKKGELVYYVFDILHFDGHNLESLPLQKRKELLRELLLSPLPYIVFSDHIENIGIEFFKQTAKLNVEGIMAKNSKSTYQEGLRSENWLKIKTHLRQEAIIAGYTSPKGSRKHFGALVLGIYEKGKLKYIGHTGGGFDAQNLESIVKKLKPLGQKECPFEEKPETNAPVTWVKPVLICEVTFAQWTKDHQMRQPIFLGLREDKNPTEIGEERIFPPSGPQKFDQVTQVIIGKQKLKLTNLAKFFWPEEKYTKGDLINYYREISAIILPYLKNRPQSLLRYPHGVKGESFFQKNVSFLSSDWIQKIPISSDSQGKKITYLLINDEESLIYTVNLGCIDLNPWNSRVASLENPDYLIIDLDPEDISFEKVVQVALAGREVLESLAIESFPKTSGARGIHIYIPMGAKYTYEQTRHFAELLCIHIRAKVPELSSMVRNPKDRQGKVYLDFLQNARGQTLASAYSVRAKPGATVSAPLKWSEVSKKLHPSQFTMKNMAKRLDLQGDLFKGILGQGIDIEKVLKKLQ